LLALLKTLLLLFLILTGGVTANAQRSSKQPEGWRVVRYESKTQEWTIIRNGTFDSGYQVKKLVVQCKWFVDTDGRRTYGPEACGLRVGQFFGFKLNLLDPNAPLLNVDDLGDTLLITEGTINRNTKQVFRIVSEQLVSTTER
jgi:hypothetical protein